MQRKYAEEPFKLRVLILCVIVVGVALLDWLFWSLSRTEWAIVAAFLLWVFALEYVGIEFSRIKDRLDRIESKLDDVQEQRDAAADVVEQRLERIEEKLEEIAKRE